MSKSILVIALSAATLTLGSNIAAAGSNTPGVDWRENNQGHRIYNGIANGSLTYREAGQLIRGQARVRRMERRFKADGVVTRGERLRLHRALNHQNRRIWRKKHN